MQNIPNMQFTQNTNYIFDPSKLDTKSKKELISKNIYQSKYGPYSLFSKCPSKAYQYIKDFNPGVPDNICTVDIVNEHCIEIAERFCPKNNINPTQPNGLNPVVLNLVGTEFAGNNFEANEEIRDEILNIRTTFNNTIGGDNPYPTKKNGCVYSNFVFVIRPRYPRINQFMPAPYIFRFGLINVSAINKPKLNKKNQMTASDYIQTLCTIELVFQVAISFGHLVLILQPFGHSEDENPTDDIIQIYNYCLLKYGHKFKHIIFAIPPHYPKEIFEEYSSKIIKIQSLFSDIDLKYNEIELKHKLKNQQSIGQQPNMQHSNMQPQMYNQTQQLVEMMKNPAFMSQIQNMINNK